MKLLARVMAILCFAGILMGSSKTDKDKQGTPRLQHPPSAGQTGPDPFLRDQWYLDHIGISDVWRKYTEGSKSTLIGIIDGGILYNDPEVAQNIWRNPKETPNNGVDDDRNGYIDDWIGWDYVKGGPLPYDRGGHGHFMATIIAGRKDNAYGGSGICPNCGILPVRFINWEGFGDDEDAIAGIYYAVRMGAKVLNLSFAGEGKDDALFKALKFAEKNDVFLVVAAGNDSENINKSAVYPARYSLSNMVTVAATGRHDELIKKSNWGDKFVHFGIPGEDIYGFWFNEWDHGSGTSDSAAIGSGIVGLMRSAAPHLKAPQIKEILLATVRHVPDLEDKTITGGVVDVEAAVACAVDPNLSCLE